MHNNSIIHVSSLGLIAINKNFNCFWTFILYIIIVNPLEKKNHFFNVGDLITCWKNLKEPYGLEVNDFKSLKRIITIIICSKNWTYITFKEYINYWI